jgi:hypothetical protein
MENNKKEDFLSMNRFKNTTDGTFKNLDSMDDDEYHDFVLAKLMKEVIESLEASIASDRVFGRTKHDVMAKFHRAREDFLK